MRASGVAGWLRQLDRDAATGDLWRRPLLWAFAGPALGAIAGAILGFVVSLALALALPNDSQVPGPEGVPITVVDDDTAVPFLGAFSGAVLGLVVGAVGSWRWQRRRRR